ncbi:MAG TPA: hypothetical protein VFU15_06150 [Bacteroidia bacterium]|nr:hypothetical protein [Bacteroidia bacterium]
MQATLRLLLSSALFIFLFSSLSAQDSVAYYPNGTKKFERHFNEKGKKILTWYDGTGKKVRVSLFLTDDLVSDSLFDNGKLVSTGFRNKGEVYGHWTYYHTNGTVALKGDYRFYRNLHIMGDTTAHLQSLTVKTGVWRSYDDKGRITRKEIYRHGYLRKYFIYDTNGKSTTTERFRKCRSGNCPVKKAED